MHTPSIKTHARLDSYIFIYICVYIYRYIIYIYICARISICVHIEALHLARAHIIAGIHNADVFMALTRLFLVRCRPRPIPLRPCPYPYHTRHATTSRNNWLKTARSQAAIYPAYSPLSHRLDHFPATKTPCHPCLFRSPPFSSSELSWFSSLVCPAISQ